MDLLLQLSIIALASLIAQWVAWRLHLPAIVFLLLFGFILGPVIGWVDPKALLGDLLKPAIAASVAIILFEGSLHLRMRDIREVKGAVRQIVIFGAPIGWLLTTLGLHYIAGLEWATSVVFGGILIVTGPTVIIPMLHNARLSSRVGNVLKWEGIINDPIGVIAAVLAYEFFVFQQNPDLSLTSYLIHHGTVIVTISIGSYLLGKVTAWILERGHMAEYLKAPFLVAMVVFLMAVCNEFLHESGLIAVTVYGMTLANIRVASIEEIRRFKETITLMLVSGVFILLTANLDPEVLLSIDIRGLLFIAAVLFLIRPITVFVSTIGSPLSFKEKALLGWIAPRGVICAAIAGVMGPLLVEAGFEDGAKLVPLAFGIVVVTVVAHSLTLKPLSQKLDLAAKRGGGLMIIGGSDWTVQLAELLKKADIPVMIADTNWHHLKAARLSNIPVYYGEILSEETAYHLELNHYGTILAATDNHAYNTLACNAFAPEMSRENVYQVSAREDAGGGPERKKVSETLQGRIFISSSKDYGAWWHLFYDGWRFRTVKPNTDLGDKFNLDNLPDTDIFIGVIDKSGHINFAAPDYMPPVKETDTLLMFSFVCEDEKQEKQKQRNQIKTEKRARKKDKAENGSA